MTDETVVLPYAPPIPGLAFRHFRGEGDVPCMQRVAHASERPDEAQEGDIPGGLEKTEYFDPYQDILLAEINGEVVGYGRITYVYETEAAREYHFLGYLLQEWRGKGLGRTLLTWLENRVREIEGMKGDGKRAVTHAGAKQHQKDLAALLEGAGYQPDRYYFVMLRPLEDIPEIPLPPGIELRPALPEHYRAVWAAVVEAAGDEGGGWSPGEADYQRWINDPLSQPELWQIAWDTAENRVAGHVLTYIPYDENAEANRRRGFTEGIGVVRAWRKRGLATALIARSLQRLKEAGMTESALVVDSDNPNGALQLYERCGFRVIERNATYRKELIGSRMDADEHQLEE